MINQEKLLKLQAFLDQELDAWEAREIAAWVETDPEAKALHAELTSITSLLRAGELECKVPESREFYWSKIERAIQSESAAPATGSFFERLPRIVRLFAPVSAAALVLVAAMVLIKLSTAPQSLSYLQEIETPLEDTGAISFHSQAAGMTVVWVQSAGN